MPRTNDLARQTAALISFLETPLLRRPLPARASASDLLARRDALLIFAGLVDRVILAVGEDAAASARGIDLGAFHKPLQDALQGDAPYELEAAADRAAAEWALS